MSQSTNYKLCSVTNGAFPPLAVKLIRDQIWKTEWKQSHDNKETVWRRRLGSYNIQTSARPSTMFYARSVVLYALLCICSSNESKIKNAPNPVRLFTEEELQRYDGREVGHVLCHKNNISDDFFKIECKMHLSNLFKRPPPTLQDGQPIYMAIKGVVFDVTTGKG